MNNRFAGTDPSGYAISYIDRVFAKQRVASDAQNGCMGNAACNSARDQQFLQGDFRTSLQFGGAPEGKGPKNGAEFNRLLKRGLTIAAAGADKIGAYESHESGIVGGTLPDKRGDYFIVNKRFLSRMMVSEQDGVRSLNFGNRSFAWD